MMLFREVYNSYRNYQRIDFHVPFHGTEAIPLDIKKHLAFVRSKYILL